MANKILSQSGKSLADVYDIQGSIAGVDELDSDAVKTVHEMGSTIFSERLGARAITVSQGPLSQNADINTNFFIGQQTARLLSLIVFQTGAVPENRIARLQVSILTPPALDNTEVPIFIWNNADGNDSCRLLLSGSVTTVNRLTPKTLPILPNILIGGDSSRQASNLSMRGLVSGFGAGTVTVSMLFLIALPDVAGGLSSKGLPMPSW